MITNFDQSQSILQILFAYVDSLTIGGVPPITGRPPMRWYSKTGTQYRDKLFYIRGVSDEKTV
ncbi:hypothetical protein BK771_03375 [Bacillus thuringiensis serovar ostriniae]|uniref:Uncharacterized protein n=1 Tax=Bacillus wiedmannii TaxID=1890302 RepID=A0A242ZJB3_9BACI|nr:hypothetical protein BK730_06805 [Bacillus wiedmannii]OTZ91237.1 hypothetical protein BK771_03375 [Bacillus thuringiensis serovar ostriniae]